jgi:hypothetical protein
MTADALPRCRWCGNTFHPRATGGRPQRFCRPACRREFFAAVRSWAVAELEAGRVTAAKLRNGTPATCALAARRGRAMAEQRHPDDIITVSFDVLPEGVENLRRGGWLTGRGDPDAIADAVAGVLQRAIAMRLRP